MRALIVGMLLTGLALAGCIGNDDVESNGNGGNGGGGGGSSSDPGAIFGRVVDGGLDPVAKADVLLLDQGGAKNVKNTTTGPDGNYRLDNVPPAEYRLVIESVCCKRGQESVTVVEGEELQLDLQLERLPDPDVSYIDTNGQWSGFISCSLSYSTSARPATCTPGDTDPNRDDVHDFDADAGLHSIVVAMEWSQSPTTTEDNLRNWILWYDEDRGDDGGYQSMARHMAPSPIEYRWDYNEPTQEPRDFQFRIYGGCCTVIPINNGLTAQQEFTVYWHLFYGERAPEGYSALPDA